MLPRIKIRPLAFFLIILPMIIAIIYYLVFASNRYVSTAEVVVRQAESGAQGNVPGLALLMNNIDPVSREETLYLREYIVSNDMLKVLEKELDWVQHYSGQWNDPLYWLSPNASAEDRLKFYQRIVKTSYDELTGLLNVEVQAFDSDFAEKILAIILERSEIFINEISQQMAKDQLDFAQQELGEATKRYEQSKDIMLTFQSMNKILDAQASAESRAGIIANLESEIVKQEARLKTLIATLSNNTPQVKAKRSEIKALQDQLEVEKERLVSAEVGDDRLNVIASQYRRLEIDVAIAEEFYKTSVSVVENAKLEATKKIRSLVRVVQPNMPEESIYPRRLYNLITILIALFLFYGIVRFIVASIEDHRE